MTPNDTDTVTIVEEHEKDRVHYDVVKHDLSVGDWCRDAIEKIIEHDTPVRQYCVLHEGMIYYLDIVCSAIKPPYDRIERTQGLVEPGTKLWMGQRAN